MPTAYVTLQFILDSGRIALLAQSPSGHTHHVFQSDAPDMSPTAWDTTCADYLDRVNPDAVRARRTAITSATRISSVA